MTVQPIPDGYGTVTPYLIVDDVRKLLTFLGDAFDATVTECQEIPDGPVMHAQVDLGTSKVMMGQAGDQWPPNPTMLYLYVEDCDAVYEQAVAAGGESVQEPRDEPYGDRNAGVKGPCGNYWWIATHVEDVPPEEIARRMAAIRAGAKN